MIRVFKDIAELSKSAAEIFIQKAREAVKKNNRFTVALTGGSSPAQLYRLLSQSPYREQVPWAQTFVFWGDERWVPLTDEKSNAGMAYELLLNQVPVPPNQIYPMWGEQPPEAFAQHYEALLRQHFKAGVPQFDLVLLGMGDDGHTASLFPGTQVLQENTCWVQAYYLEPQAMYRITLTAPCINQANNILFLTYGEKKADALYEVLAGEKNVSVYPAQLIKPLHGETFWLVDEAAASRLPAQN